MGQIRCVPLKRQGVPRKKSGKNIERVAGRSNLPFRTGAILILSKQLEGAPSSCPGSEYSRSTLSENASPPRLLQFVHLE